MFYNNYKFSTLKYMYIQTSVIHEWKKGFYEAFFESGLSYKTIQISTDA
jgi:hypothetical protein